MMAAFVETLAPVDILFLVMALISALNFLLWTFWLSLKGGIRGETANLAFREQASSRLSMFFHAVLGFMMMFGVIGLALRRLAEAEPLWALLGALAAGGMLTILVAGRDDKR